MDAEVSDAGQIAPQPGKREFGALEKVESDLYQHMPRLDKVRVFGPQGPLLRVANRAHRSHPNDCQEGGRFHCFSLFGPE